jgi:DNA-binding LacI/PurR family transcriptional regulator
MVEETVRTMLARIDTPNMPARRVAIDGPLIVRGSARIPEGWTP